MEYLRDLVPILMPVIIVIVTGLATLASAALVKLMRKLGLDEEALNREALQSALTNAAMLAIARGVKLQPGVMPTVPAVAIEYVLRSTPDAVAKFGLTPERIADMIVPKIVAAEKQGDVLKTRT